MNPKNLTIKVQELLQIAQQKAFNLKHANIDVLHIFLAIIGDIRKYCSISS